MIVFCILFIYKSRKIYNNLKTSEELFRKKKREVIHNFVPVMMSLSSQNKSIQTVLELNKLQKKEILLLLLPFLYKAFVFFQSTAYGIDLTKKLRNSLFT